MGTFEASASLPFTIGCSSSDSTWGWSSIQPSGWSAVVLHMLPALLLDSVAADVAPAVGT